MQSSMENKFLKMMMKIIYNPLALSICLYFLILIGFFCAGAGNYETTDDQLLRTLVDGSFNRTPVGSYFLLYSSSLIGRLLVFLYSNFPGYYWYDIFQLSLMSFSSLVIGYSVFSKKKLTFNIFCLLTLFFILTPLFIRPQFTFLSGTLAIAAIVYAVKLLNEGLNSKIHLFFSFFLLFFLSLFSGLIRHEAYLIVTFVGFIYFTSFFRRQNYKRFILLTICGLVIILIVTAIFYVTVIIDRSNSDIDYAINANKYLVLLYNNTIAGNSPFIPWLPIENKIENLTEILSRYGWYKGDYRLLLSWADIGDFDVFSNSNKFLIYSEIGDLISIKSNYKFGFYIQDYFHLFKVYLIIPFALLIVFFNRRALIYFILYVGFFFVLVCVLNIFFRSLPQRLWINFCNLYIIIFLYYLKINSTSILDKLNGVDFPYKKIIKIISLIVFVIVFSFFSFSLLRKVINQSKLIKKEYKILINQVDKLDERKIYLVDVYIWEISTRPFKKSIFQTNKKFLPLGSTEFLQHRQLFESLKLPGKNTWDYICSKSNVEILTYVGGRYNDFYFTMIQKAVYQHMMDRYGKKITFKLSQDIGNLKSYKCITK